MSDQNFQQRLRDSDVRYFQAAALNKYMLGGQLSFMPGLSSQAGACVLHSLERLPQRDEAWLESLEQVFLQHDIKRSRLYLQQNSPEDEAFLTRHGYRPVVEIGFATRVNLQHLHGSRIQALDLVAIDEQLWPLHHRLLASSEVAPDGHRMQADQYALLERRKVAAGCMQSFLYIEDGVALAVASLDITDRFARVKNLLVHPGRRGRGMGKSLVARLMLLAHQQGAQAIGAFALAENQAACAMYRTLGMRKVYQQYEWLKTL